MKADHELTCEEIMESAEDLVENGHAMLNRHRLSDAEELFHRVLELPDYTVHQHYRHIVAALLGLSEVYTKRGRTMRNNDLEWHRMYMHAASSKRKAIDLCNEALDHVKEAQDITWFKENKNRIEHSLQIIEETFAQSIKDRTLRLEETDTKNQESKARVESLYNKENADNMVLNKSSSQLNMTWLENFKSYYKEKCSSSQLQRWQSRDELVIEDTEEEKPPEPEPKEEVKKQINYDKVQAAIQKIVKRIAEMGHLKIHPNMTPEEKLSLLSPLSDEFNVFKQFSKVLNNEDSSDSGSGENEDAETPGTEETLSLEEALAAEKSGAKLSREGSVEPRLTKEEETQSVPSEKQEHKPKDENAKSVTFATSSLSSSKWQSLENIHSQYLNTSRSAPVREGDVLKHGVLRVWRCYSKNRESTPENEVLCPKYHLQTFEEMSPLTEMVGQSKRSQCDIDLENDHDGLPERTPVSEMNLNITFAHSICHIARQLKLENQLSEASKMYKLSLGIIQENMCSRNDSALLTLMGKIIQNLGLIKCTQGDLVGGSRLMEEAITLYQESGQRGKELKVVKVWFDLGEAYLADQWKEMTFSEHVMKTVQEVLQRDFKREVVDEPDDIADDVSETDSSDGEESYSVCTEEAITCFYNALSILRKVSHMTEEYATLLVEVLTKLGDCMIMVGNFDQATLRYEEALGMFKNIIGSATLQINAHVLSMLATSNFLLSNYPKAVSMYECANLLAQHIYGGELATFDVAFTLTMLGICHYCMKHYHKCISWCLKAFGIYSFLYKDQLHSIPPLQRWFVTQTLYTLGYSYGTINFHEKAMHYLKLSRNMLLNVEEYDLKQCVRILKAIADEYVKTDQNEASLEYYSEALDMSMALGNEKSTTALQNQLLNRMANVHVSSKQYENAAEYLRQALDYQKNVENNIKDDMVNILRQLGLTYTMSGDMEKAIECYSECLDAYSEMPGCHASETAQVLGTLGTLCHVKACLQEDNDEMMSLLLTAEKHYQDAMELDSNSSVCVQYANYLYQQAQAADALLAMLPYVHIHSNKSESIKYYGVEQAVLPEHLQQEVDDSDEVELEGKVFAQFLAILCYKQLHLIKDAEECLIELLKEVTDSQVPLNHSLLGYAFLEMNMHAEAAESFKSAAALSHDNKLAITNYWLSIGTLAFITFAKGLQNIYEYYHKDSFFQQWLSSMPLLPISSGTAEQVEEAAEATSGIRDSGYYDHGIPGEKEEPTTEEHWNTAEVYPVEGACAIAEDSSQKKATRSAHETWVQNTETVETPAAILQAMIAEHNREEEAILEQHDEQHMDRGYYSSEYLERQGLEDAEDRVVQPKWESQESMDTLTGVPEEIEVDINESTSEMINLEETVETPDAILQLLMQQQEAVQRESVLYGALLGLDRSPEDAEEVTLTEEIDRPVLSLSGSWRSSVPDLYTSQYSYMSGLTPSTSESRINSSSKYMSSESLKTSESTNTLDYEITENPVESEEWVIEEEEVETPMAIMQVLSNQATTTGVSSTSIHEDISQTSHHGDMADVLDQIEVSRESSQSDPDGFTSQVDVSGSQIKAASEQKYVVTTTWQPSQVASSERSISTSRETSKSRETTPFSTTSSSSYHSVTSYIRLSEERLEEENNSEEEEVLQEQEESLDEVTIEEEVVETPVAVLRAIQRAQEERESLSRNRNDEIPMETSPDVETAPEPSYSSSWSSRSYSSRPTSHYSSSNNVVDNAKVHCDSPEEVVWVTEETVSTPSAILEAIQNNNNRSEVPTPTHSTTSFTSCSEKEEGSSHHDSWYKEEADHVTSPVIYESWNTESIRYPTVTVKTTEEKKESVLHKDGNGNHHSASTAYHYQNISEPENPEVNEEEKWETWEETEVIETPPEILQALLRAQQV